MVVGTLSAHLCAVTSESERRIGKVSEQTWGSHSALAQNLEDYSDSLQYPDFSGVGALLSSEGVLGTASLVAPNVAITAAHVLKNSQSDPEPIPADWDFILHPDYQNAPSERSFSVQKIVLHPSWATRQNQKPPLGDGDTIGVDLALLFLSSKVVEVQPYALPFENGENLLGKIAFVSGFGTLINGSDSNGNDQNTRRMAGQNQIDRVVPQILVTGLDANESGGVFAFDFDSPGLDANTLGGENDPIDQLGLGTSSAQPLSMEVSTAVGDSGGPVFAWTNGNWKLHGVVSYGSYGQTGDSTYGDVTVLTRLETHLPWIEAQLSVWPSNQFLPVEDNAPKILDGNVSLNYSFSEDSNIRVDLNVTDADGDSHLWMLEEGPFQGTASINPTTGLVVYTPWADYSGNDYLRVRVNDGSLSDSAILNFSVTPINDLPQIHTSADLEVFENKIELFKINASDIDGDALEFSLSGGTDRSMFAIDKTTGKLTFESSPNFESPIDANGDNKYEFEVSVWDGTNSTKESFCVSVIDLAESPMIDDNYPDSILSLSLEEDSSVYYDFDASDPDIGSLLTWSIMLSPSHGQAFIETNTGLLTYKPNSNYSGSDSLHVAVSDGSFNVSRLVNIDVRSVNDRPVFSSGSSFSVDEGTVKVTNLRAFDADGDKLKFVISGGPDEKRFSLDPSTGELNFLEPPSFDNPRDHNADNQYFLTISVTDSMSFSIQEFVIHIQEVESKNNENIHEKILSNVATIYINNDSNDNSEEWVSQGSGFLIDNKGTLVTNYHVIEGMVSGIAKFGLEEEEYQVMSILYTDELSDLALIKIDSDHEPMNLSLQLPEIGEEVFIYGTPLGVAPTLSKGVINGLRMTFENGREWLRFSNPVSPGNSGGPLTNVKGEVIGVVTFGITQANDLNYASPVKYLKDLLSGIPEKNILTEFNDIDSNERVETELVIKGIDLGIGWRKSSWFDTFYASSVPWLYHQFLGWIFLDESDENIWLYQEQLGWLWTDSAIYPFLYRFFDESGNWLYLERDLYPPKVYDYGKRSWIILD